MEEAKKSARKRKRYLARFRTFREIRLKNEPFPSIILFNVGQATGLEKQTILKILENLGGIKLKRFIAQKGESYSFIEFNNVEDAKLFFKTWNGKVISGASNSPIYLSYVESVPDNEMVCPDVNPNGLILLQNFISAEEEKLFIELFDWIEESNLKNRLVKHYGYRFRYGSNDVDNDAPLEEKIPEQCELLWERLREYGVEFEIPDQLTVNKYVPGQGIPCHVDRHSPFGNTIMSLSLGSSIVMDWKHHSGTYIPVVVPNRSFLVMQGEARYDWQHGIPPRTWDPVIESRGGVEAVRVVTYDTVPRETRISLTFRKTRVGPCICAYQMLCDSDPVDRGIDDRIAEKLEELHVHQVYEQIAGHFSSTRRRAWPRVAQALREAPAGAVVLDLGAGNGKNVLPRTDLLQIACERSEGLLAECRQRVAGAADCVRLDLLRPGLRAACADLVLCVAVIHHLGTPARRKEAVRVIAELLRPGGRALITVWARDQGGASYVCAGRAGSAGAVATVGGVRLPVHENRTQFQHSDLLVPWKMRDQTTTLLRYYHVFEEGELEALCRRPDLALETSFYDEGNWCVICTKI